MLFQWCVVELLLLWFTHLHEVCVRCVTASEHMGVATIESSLFLYVCVLMC